MKPGWQTVPMSAVMAEFYDGPHATPPPADDGPIYLGIKNMTEDGHLDLSEIRHIAEKDFPEWTRRVEPRAGDLVFTYEASLHRYAIIPPGFRGTLGRRVALLRVNPRIVNTRFLLFAFISPLWRRTVQERLNIGSTVDRLPLIDFPNFPITIPPLQVQRKIAAVLSAYDDLIENNRRRIKVLEEMAQRIYREWFVDFRYPGHQDVPLLASEVGAIPVNWRIAPLSSVCERMQAGGTPLRTNAAYWLAGTIDWYKTNELWDNFLYQAEERVTQRAVDAAKTRVFPAGTLLMAIYGAPTVGRIGILTKPGACNQAALALSTDQKLISQILLYFILMELRGHFNAIAQGAAQQNISKEKVGNTIVAYPPTALSKRFTEAVQPLWEGRSVLGEAVRKLGAARDFLLPRLISGEIDVEDLDIVVDDAAA